MASIIRKCISHFSTDRSGSSPLQEFGVIPLDFLTLEETGQGQSSQDNNIERLQVGDDIVHITIGEMPPSQPGEGNSGMKAFFGLDLNIDSLYLALFKAREDGGGDDGSEELGLMHVRNFCLRCVVQRKTFVVQIHTG